MLDLQFLHYLGSAQCRSGKGQNVALSPISLALCFAMLAAGATDQSETQTELLAMLNVENE